MSGLARSFIAFGALNLAVAVALDAAARHAWQNALSIPSAAEWFQAGLRYHQLHALGLICVGVIWPHCGKRWLAAAGGLMLIGIALFSVNLYLRSLAGFHDFHAWVPLGGTAYILSWLSLAVGALVRAD